MEQLTINAVMVIHDNNYYRKAFSMGKASFIITDDGTGSMQCGRLTQHLELAYSEFDYTTKLDRKQRGSVSSNKEGLELFIEAVSGCNAILCRPGDKPHVKQLVHDAGLIGIPVVSLDLPDAYVSELADAILDPRQDNKRIVLTYLHASLGDMDNLQRIQVRVQRALIKERAK